MLIGQADDDVVECCGNVGIAIGVNLYDPFFGGCFCALLSFTALLSFCHVCLKIGDLILLNQRGLCCSGPVNPSALHRGYLAVNR